MVCNGISNWKSPGVSPDHPNGKSFHPQDAGGSVRFRHRELGLLVAADIHASYISDSSHATARHPEHQPCVWIVAGRITPGLSERLLCGFPYRGMQDVEEMTFESRSFFQLLAVGHGRWYCGLFRRPAAATFGWMSVNSGVNNTLQSNGDGGGEW